MDLRKFMIAALAASATAAVAHANKQTSAQGSSNRGSVVTAQADGSSGQNMQQDASTVRQAQQALNDKGYNAGSADGQWGARSRAAAKKFQQAQGLQPSGQLDSQTLAALDVNGTNGMTSDQNAAQSASQGPSDTSSSFSPNGSQPSPRSAESSDDTAQSSSSSTPSATSQTSSYK